MRTVLSYCQQTWRNFLIVKVGVRVVRLKCLLSLYIWRSFCLMSIFNIYWYWRNQCLSIDRICLKFIYSLVLPMLRSFVVESVFPASLREKFEGLGYYRLPNHKEDNRCYSNQPQPPGQALKKSRDSSSTGGKPDTHDLQYPTTYGPVQSALPRIIPSAK